MTDENQENQQQEQEQQQGKTFTEAEVQALIQKEIGALKAKNDELIGEKRAEAEKKRLAEEEAKRLAEDQARKNGDLEAIEKSWSEKYTNNEAILKAQIEEYRTKNYELTVGRQATEMAGKLAKPHAQRLLEKEIKSRLSLDESGNIRVLDTQGKPSALTLAELEAELRSDETYQDIIIINNSTGGGATGGGFGGGAGKEAKDYTIEERAELLQKNPVLFKKLFSK